MKKTAIKYPALSDIDLRLWCRKLECDEEELLYCLRSVGTSWVCVEAFWSMNQDRIRFSIHNIRPESTLLGAQINRLS